MSKLHLYRIEDDYLDYLSNKESRIPQGKYNGKDRPFVGVVYTINNLEYFAPLSSQLHNKQSDFKVIIANEHKATVRFAYMFPVTKDCLIEIDFTEEYKKDRKYTALLINEAQYINQHQEDIYKIASRTYEFNVTKRYGYDKFCCNFLLLEVLAKNYQSPSNL